MKKKVDARLTEEQLRWIDTRVEREEFASRSHGIRFCVEQMRRELTEEDSRIH